MSRLIDLISDSVILTAIILVASNLSNPSMPKSALQVMSGLFLFIIGMVFLVRILGHLGFFVEEFIEHLPFRRKGKVNSTHEAERSSPHKSTTTASSIFSSKTEKNSIDNTKRVDSKSEGELTIDPELKDKKIESDYASKPEKKSADEILEDTLAKYKL